MKPRSNWMLITVVLLGLPSFFTRVDAAETGLVDAVECRVRGGLPNVLAKLETGGPVRVAYLGGSITAQPGWRVYTTKYLQEAYPKAKVEEVFAAIGGTNATLGVYRNRKDVLAHKPDLLFIEFAVNDGGTAPEEIHRSMEGLVRQTWEADPKTDICFVYTFTDRMLETLKSGKFPRSASAMETVADHYAIPTIHMGLEAVKKAREGKLLMRAKLPKTDAEKAGIGDKFVFAPDGVHPHVKTGHKLYAEAVQRSIPKCKTGPATPHRLKAPLRADHYASARMEPVSKVQRSAGWQQLGAGDPIAKRFKRFMPEMWMSGKPGASITVKFKGTALGFFDIMGPDVGALSVSVDGGPERKVLRFDAYCTYHRMNNFIAARGLPDGEHTVVVKIHAEVPDKAKILAKRKQTMKDPKRFEGTNWRVAYVMLMGELLRE